MFSSTSPSILPDIGEEVAETGLTKEESKPRDHAGGEGDQRGIELADADIGGDGPTEVAGKQDGAEDGSSGKEEQGQRDQLKESEEW